MISFNILTSYLEQISYTGLFLILIFVGILIPVPEEIILLLLGYSSALGYTRLYIVIIISILGVSSGDFLLYSLSKKGNGFISRIQQKFRKDKFSRYDSLMINHAPKAIFFLRFIVGIRILGPLLAGLHKIKAGVFLFYDLLAVSIYAPLLIFLGYHFHNSFLVIVSNVILIRHIIFILVVIGGVGVLSSYFWRKLGRPREEIPKTKNEGEINK